MSLNRWLTRSSISILILILSFAVVAKVTEKVNAELLSMPEETVAYTITRINGVLWAKIDGEYPIHYDGNDESIWMIYPTPPGTMNISILFNNVKLAWSNFTSETHHTAIGEWDVISTLLEPISENFVLKIHYEHPVQIINDSYMFLYDLNIASYLSATNNKSVCHYSIRMESEYTNFKVNTVAVEDERLKPIVFTVSGSNPAEIKIDETSEFGKPLPGDLLVSFSEPETQTVSDWWIGGSILIIAFIVVILIINGLIRRRKNS